jgi:hypothetical protein
VLPYFGLADECRTLMLSLCRRSHNIWQENEEILLLRIIKNRRSLTLDSYEEEILDLVNIASLKYFNIQVETPQKFLISLLNRLIKVDFPLAWKSGVCPGSPATKVATQGKLLNSLKLSECPAYLFLNGATVNLEDKEAISAQISRFDGHGDRCTFAPTAKKVEFLGCFTLTDSTELVHFQSHQRRVKAIQSSIMTTTEEKEALLSKPFIQKIGIIKVEVSLESVLTNFLKTCDTSVGAIEIIRTPHFDRDLFSFQEEVSKTLVSTVKEITTNREFEKTCHWFTNSKTITVENFPALSNFLGKQSKVLNKVSIETGNYDSVITINNAFVTTNEDSTECFYAKAITAHFSREDIQISDECSHLYIGGNMIRIEGIDHTLPSQEVSSLLKQGVDPEKGAQKLVVLLENFDNYPIIQKVKDIQKLQRQNMKIETESKYVALKVKKASCQLTLNSNSAFSLRYQKVHHDFLHFLKSFLNGRCSLSSMKLAQALQLQVIESLHFDVQNYADSLKILDQVSKTHPSSVRKFGITSPLFESQNADEGKFEQVDNLLKKWVKESPGMEILVQRKQTNESQTCMYYTPIMQSIYEQQY